ncbi:MAG: hypothetical protein R2699_10475 [Acidimicrobiales bacterium]
MAPARMGAMADLLARLHAAGRDLPIDGPTTEERAMALRRARHPRPDVCRWIETHHRPTATTVVHLDFHAERAVRRCPTERRPRLAERRRGRPRPRPRRCSAGVPGRPDGPPAVLRPAEQVLREALAARLVGRYRHHRRADDAQLRVGTVLAASRRLLGAILDRPAPEPRRPGSPALSSSRRWPPRSSG